MSASVDEHSALVATISNQSSQLSTLVHPASIEHVRYTSTMFQYLIDLLNRTNSHKLTDITGKKRTRKDRDDAEQSSSTCHDSPSQRLSLLSLCRRNADVIESKVFPFLDLRDHIRLACASSVFLQQSGLKPPPHPLPPAPPLPRHVIKYGAWKKSVRLPPQVTNSQLMLFCGFAQSVHTLELTQCRQITDISALANIRNLRTLTLSQCGQLTDVSALGKIPKLYT